MCLSSVSVERLYGVSKKMLKQWFSNIFITRKSFREIEFKTCNFRTTKAGFVRRLISEQEL